MAEHKISIERDVVKPNIWHLVFSNSDKDKRVLFVATFTDGAYKARIPESQHDSMVLMSVNKNPETRLEINVKESTVLHYNVTSEYIYFRYTLPKQFMDELASYCVSLPTHQGPHSQGENVLREKVINLDATNTTDPTPLVGGKRKKSRRQTRKRKQSRNRL
jgi:hypothetical protein